MQFKLEVATDATDELIEAFHRLIPQLTQNNPPPSPTHLAALVKSGSSTLLIARADESAIVGALSLTVYRVPTGIRSLIEDLIVEKRARRQGIGEALMRRAMELAKEKGAQQLTLTSNSSRDAANRLYLRMGFRRRETNAYIFRF